MANPEQNNNSANVLFWFRNTVKRNVACECDISLATPVATPAAKRTRPTSPASVETRPNTGYLGDRKSVVSGKSVSVRVDLGGRRGIKKKKKEDHKSDKNT